MENILSLVEQLPVEQLRTIQARVESIADTKIKQAVSEVKETRLNEYKKMFTYNGKSIITEYVRNGLNIYEAVVGKSGKLIKGDLIAKDSHRDNRNVKFAFRMGFDLSK